MTERGALCTAADRREWMRGAQARVEQEAAMNAAIVAGARPPAAVPMKGTKKGKKTGTVAPARRSFERCA